MFFRIKFLYFSKVGGVFVKMAKNMENARVKRISVMLLTLLTLLTLALLLASCSSMSITAETTEPHIHAWTPWETAKKATCTEEGEETRNCTCGEEESRSIPKTEHSYLSVATGPNGAQKGYTTYICECGDSYTDHYEDSAHQDKNQDNVCDTCGYLDLVPGLYDAKNKLLATWDALVNTYGMEVDTDYTWSSDQTKKNSPCYLLANTSALQTGVKLILGDVTHIGNEAFEDCNTLTSIIISDYVTSIGDEAFYHCTSLTDITIPNSVTSIGRAAFYGCEALTSVKIGSGVTSIGSSMFGDCISLASVTIPDSVTIIDFQAFLNCASLTNVTVGNCVTRIEKNAFADCKHLASITIPNSVTSIATKAFGDCISLASIAFTGTVDEWNAVSKESGWIFHIPATQIVCSDGTVELSN